MEKRNRAMLLLAMADEVYRLYFAFRELEESTPCPGGSLGRSILLTLHLQGRRSVPDLAYRHSLTRQRVQQVVNVLLREELLHRRENPGHKRSYLLELSGSGRKRARELLHQERKFFRNRISWVKDRKIIDCTLIMREFREEMERRRESGSQKAGRLFSAG